MKIRSLADDRNLAIKTADKGLCVAVWDRNDHNAKQKNNLITSVYKKIIFKEKILQDLAETSNNIFKSLRGTYKLTEKQLKYFTFAHKKHPNLGKVYYLKFKNDFLMFLTDQLYRTVTCLQKRYRSF